MDAIVVPMTKTEGFGRKQVKNKVNLTYIIMFVMPNCLKMNKFRE